MLPHEPAQSARGARTLTRFGRTTTLSRTPPPQLCFPCGKFHAPERCGSTGAITLEGVPSRTPRKLEVTNIRPDSDADAGPDRGQCDIIGFEELHTHAAHQISGSLHSAEAAVNVAR